MTIQRKITVIDCFILVFVIFLFFPNNRVRSDINKELDSILLKAHSSRTNTELYKYLNEYLKIAKENKLKDKEALAYYEFTKFSWLNGYYSEALEYSSLAIDSYKLIKDEDGIGKTLVLLGNIYSECDDTIKAFEYYNKALNIYHRTKNIHLEAIIYGNFAAYYSSSNDFDNTEFYAKKAIGIFQKLDDKMGLADNYSFIADVYFKRKQFDKALEYYKKSFDLYSMTSDSHHICLTYLSIGLTYHKLNKNKLAEKFINTGLDIISRYNSIDGKPEFLTELISYYKSKKDFNTALLYSEKLSAWKDTLSKYNTSKAEKKFELKAQEEKFQNEKNNLIKEQAFKNQFYIFLVLISLLIIISIIVVLNIKIRNNKKIQTINSKLAQLNSTKDKFFSIISHDLRTPLNSFNDLISLLNNYYDDFTIDEIKKYIGTLKKSSDNLLLLLENLLLWANLQSKGIEPIQENIVLTKLINQEINNLKEFAELKEIKIVNNVGTNLSAYADKDMISVVIRNIISNSIKFSSPKSQVIISGHSENGFVEISVLDTGVGISDEVKEKIFKLESKYSTIGTNNEKGTGLGLSLCKEFIEKNNGKIWFESEANVGTNFFFTLPIESN
ncbi:MAG: tetratricopeptide repeat protein [Candidatus Kapabacteria bacterium]|nr:tetratricopeptide repeat protein [Candidatus Kapabacteria bacterium]